VRPGRGDVGSGLFERVFFVDVFDGPQGLARVRTLTLAAPTSRLSQVISTGHEVALEDDRSPMLLLPQAGSIFCALGPRDMIARPGQALVVPRGRRRTVTRRDGERMFAALVLRLPDPALGSVLSNGATLNLRDLPDLSLAAGLLAGLTRPGPEPVEILAERLHGAERLVAGALAGLMVAEGGRPRAPGADRALRRAEALMRDRFGEDLAIGEVADLAGLSVRQLQHLFACTHGLSPHAWLTRLRLEEAHLRLKGAAPAPTVTQAALSAGLTHLGRFPALYRRRFGSLPSAGRAALP
jgi:AraC-like DNA-binding protein